MARENDEHLRERFSNRKLLILGLLCSGMTQKQVAAALGLDRSQVSRMFPAGALSDLQKKTGID